MERLKNMGLKKSFFFLSVWCVMASLLLVLLVFLICGVVSNQYPSGGVELGADGIVVPLEQPTPDQQRILTLLAYFQWLSCIIFPVSGLGLAGTLFYHIKLKTPISILRDGTEHIRSHDLDFSIPIVSTDELGQICAAFETMRLELLKTNQELWRQSEERKRLNAAFAHDLRNPITVLKGSIKLLRQDTADKQSLDRLESYTLRIEQYVEAMSSIQRLEQIPIQASDMVCAALRTELEETAQLLSSALDITILAPDVEMIRIDHGIFLTVAENLIGNAARFAQKELKIVLALEDDILSLSVMDDGCGFPAELLKSGPQPFGKLEEKAGHFGMGLYSSTLLCRKHGGDLCLKNEPEGGATAIASFQINFKS